jgi:hypothetical protein
MIDVNLIVTKSNTIVTLHLNDEERGSERLAPYGELHGDDASSLHWVAPHAVKHQIGLHELVVFTYKLLEDEVWHQVDNITTVDEHPRDWPLVNVSDLPGAS